MPGEPNDGARNPAGEPGSAPDGTKSEAQIRTEVEAELRAQLIPLLEGSGAYTSLQRAMSKADRETKAALAQRDATIAALQESLNGYGEGMQYLSTTLMSALPEEERAKAEADLRSKQLARQDQEIRNLRKEMQAPRQQPEFSPEHADIQEQIAVLEREVVDALEDLVKGHGLDPRDKGIDYGTPEDKFAVRAKKLNLSIVAAKKAKDAADVNDVRQKAVIPGTNTNGSTPPGNPLGKTYAERGADEIWDRMKRSAQR